MAGSEALKCDGWGGLKGDGLEERGGGSQNAIDMSCSHAIYVPTESMCDRS